MYIFFSLLALLLAVMPTITHYPTAITINAHANNYANNNCVPHILILHYTSESLAQTLKIFLGYEEDKKTSSHYAISKDGIVFHHVPENMRAYHAGTSYWNGLTSLNTCSLGIEHVNRGFKDKPEKKPGIKVAGCSKEWYSFCAEQIEASMQLCHYLIKKYNIEPRNVLAHSDVAPGRKSDPGPLFPWKQFADQGIGAWPDAKKSWQLPCLLKAKNNNALPNWLINHLHIWGYQKPDAKTSAKDIIQAFQMHFRQHNISGIADEETATIVNNLLCNFILKKKGTACPCR